MSRSLLARMSSCLSLVFISIFAGALAVIGQTNEGSLTIPASILLTNPPPVYFRNASKAAPAPGLLQSLPQSPLPATNFLARIGADVSKYLRHGSGVLERQKKRLTASLRTSAECAYCNAIPVMG